jgi:hypothetical protein
MLIWMLKYDFILPLRENAMFTCYESFTLPLRENAIFTSMNLSIPEPIHISRLSLE